MMVLLFPLDYHGGGLVVYDIHMRRTNLVLDGELLEQATRDLGLRTYSAAVNYALAEVLRIRKVQSLAGYFGQDLWHGDLKEMREDRKPKAPRPRR